jgi:prolipoprotein diacylglyceryltransferase
VADTHPGRVAFGIHRMDYSLVVLIGLIVATLFVSTKLNRRGWPGRPGSEYQVVFSTAAVGLLFTVAGAIGWDLSYSHGWFQDTKWVDGPIWWQIGLGVASLALSAFFARRVRPRRTTR